MLPLRHLRGLLPKIEHKENRPALVEYDPLCGLCFTYCPRTFLDMGDMESKLFGRTRNPDEALGIYKKAVSAQAVSREGKAQDGGVATALLVQALESGIIDCAVVTDRDEEWRTVSRVATTADEIRAAAGTKYTINNSVIAVKEALEKGCDKIGFVGTPCQIEALRKVLLLEEPYQFGQEKIALLVGLFCMENFDYDLLMTGLVKGKFGLDPKDVARFEIKKGMFRVIDKEGKAHEVKIEETDQYTLHRDAVPALTSPASSRTSPWEAWARLKAGPQFSPARMPARSSTLPPSQAGVVQEKAVSEKGLALARRLAESKVKRFESKSVEMNVSGITR